MCQSTSFIQVKHYITQTHTVRINGIVLNFIHLLFRQRLLLIIGATYCRIPFSHPTKKATADRILRFGTLCTGTRLALAPRPLSKAGRDQ